MTATMDLSIGLPNTLKIAGPKVVDWAHRAEQRGFRSLATIDRIAYPSYDSLTSLAAAAGATSTIGLFPNILLTPAYPKAWLAKATASLDAISDGRLTLGLGVGARQDDFTAMERPFAERGRLMDETLDFLRRAWAGEHVTGGDHRLGPPPPGDRVSVLVGGESDAAIRRTVEYGQGWTASGGPPDAAAAMVEKVRRSWRAAGRDGEPRIAALLYFGFGDEGASRAALLDYYGYLGPIAEQIAGMAIRTPQAATEAVRAYGDAGVTELVFDPTVADVAEVDRLADAVL